MVGYILKNILVAAVGIGIALALSAGVVSLECFLLDQFGLVYPTPPTDIGGWLDSFKNAALWATLTGLAAAIVWDIVAYFSSGRWSDRRRFWELLLVLSIGTSAWLCFYMPLESQSAVWPTVLGGLGGAICFLVATVPFTPDPLKYTPWLAATLRFRY
jgi:hypothetical protein